MENVIIFMICAALTIFGGMTLSQNFLSSVDASTSGLSAMQEREYNILRTNLTPLTASQPSADTVEVTIENTGQTKLSDFNRWDVIIQYYGTDSAYHIVWLPYVPGTPASGQWTVKGIYLNAGTSSPEAFEPGIFNMREEMIVQATLNPPVKVLTSNLISVSTPNGVSAAIGFTGYKP
jgi:hypothetical protein